MPTIRIYIHPGRAFVGQIEPERLEEQFDLASARWFPSLGEAELAAEGRSGFLVEIKGAFTDLDGRRRGRAGLFVPALRR